MVSTYQSIIFQTNFYLCCRSLHFQLLGHTITVPGVFLERDNNNNMFLERRQQQHVCVNALHGIPFPHTGFIAMTPQLFINYKLKSVAHLPWRMLTYKALNTFIDDLFAFVIKMPTLYRLGVFRDGRVYNAIIVSIIQAKGIAYEKEWSALLSLPYSQFFTLRTIYP